jgi:hypothetical protein
VVHPVSSFGTQPIGESGCIDAAARGRTIARPDRSVENGILAEPGKGIVRYIHRDGISERRTID